MKNVFFLIVALGFFVAILGPVASTHADPNHPTPVFVPTPTPTPSPTPTLRQIDISLGNCSPLEAQEAAKNAPSCSRYILTPLYSLCLNGWQTVCTK